MKNQQPKNNSPTASNCFVPLNGLTNCTHSILFLLRLNFSCMRSNLMEKIKRRGNEANCTSNGATIIKFTMFSMEKISVSCCDFVCFRANLRAHFGK